MKNLQALDISPTKCIRNIKTQGTIIILNTHKAINNMPISEIY
jgi:hypothetical protein